MPRRPVVTRKVKVHSYDCRYVKGSAIDKILSGTFTLPKEYKTHFSVALNIEKLYGVHLLSIDAHHVEWRTYRQTLEEFILHAETINIEGLMDEYYSSPAFRTKY